MSNNATLQVLRSNYGHLNQSTTQLIANIIKKFWWIVSIIYKGQNWKISLLLKKIWRIIWILKFTPLLTTWPILRLIIVLNLQLYPYNGELTRQLKPTDHSELRRYTVLGASATSFQCCLLKQNISFYEVITSGTYVN